MTAKIGELLKEDIIRKLEGPTTWASPVVVAPKQSGGIRFCVDMRCANEAIIERVLEGLNGITVFSRPPLWFPPNRAA